MIALAAACVRPNPERRKTSLLVAKALETVIADCVARAGGLEKLRGDVSAAEARARGVTEKLENFAAMKPRRRREAEAAAIKMQAAYRGRIARRRVRALREGAEADPTRLGLLDAEQEAALAARFERVGDAEYAAAVMIQKCYRGKLARREIMARLDADAAAAAEKESDALGRFSAATSTSGRQNALSLKEAAARDAAFAQIFARIASMLADHDGAVQAAAAAALSVYVDPEEGPESCAAAEAAVRAGALGPLVGVFCSKNARAVEDAATCLETITIEFPSEQNRALRAGALEGALRLMVSGNAKDPKALAARAAGARALRGLLLQNPPACRRAMEKGGLDVLIALMDTEDAACQAAASSALSALADAVVGELDEIRADHDAWRLKMERYERVIEEKVAAVDATHADKDAVRRLAREEARSALYELKAEIGNATECVADARAALAETERRNAETGAAFAGMALASLLSIGPGAAMADRLVTVGDGRRNRPAATSPAATSPADTRDHPDVARSDDDGVDGAASRSTVPSSGRTRLIFPCVAASSAAMVSTACSDTSPAFVGGTSNRDR